MLTAGLGKGPEVTAGEEHHHRPARAAMRAGEPSPVAPPLVSLGQPIWFWVLTVLVPLASPESPPPASSDHHRSSPAPSLPNQGTRPVSDRERAQETKRGPRADDWATLSR
jgi:hypothetical protein